MSKGNKEVESPAEPVVEAKLDDLDSKIANAVGKAIEAALPIAAGVAARAAAGSQPPPAPSGRKKRSLGGKCVKCRQYLVACKGEHRKLVVYPKDPYWARHFQGIKVNGVVYCSNNGRHQITVPLHSSIENDVVKFEAKERDLFQKKHRVHHSGDVRNPRKDRWRSETNS